MHPFFFIIQLQALHIMSDNSCKILDPDEGFVHSVETGGTVDGPGIRFVVFLSGCPLRCLYCHNPDTRYKSSGKRTRAESLVSEIIEYKDFFQHTNGGVTVSGGEPLIQQDFVTAIFKGCKENNIHTALDTSGWWSGKEVSQELLDNTDLVLLDIKSFDPKTYERVTKQKLEPTLQFLQKLAALKKPTWIRCVLVPGLTDQLEHYNSLADYLITLGNIEKVEILPFHKMGENKWKSMGLTYELSDTLPPSKELVTQVQDIFKKRGLDVH